MRTGLKIPHVICFLLLLGSGDFQVRWLRVTGKDVPSEALRGEDVTISCRLSGVPIPLNLEKLAVVWTLRLQNGTEHEVYGFSSYQHMPLRPGSHMRDKDLQQGNASLFIPNIQITDEGVYRCFVIFTPDSDSATSTLQVSVKPQTALSHDQHIELGITGSVRCEVSNFYPEAVKIRWVKSSKSNSRSSPWDKDVSFTTPLGNSDGTFSVTSELTVEPSTDAEPGDVLFCIVSHRSLEEEMTLSFTMPRRNPVKNISNASVAVLIISLLTFFWRNFFTKISGPMMKVVLGVIFTVSSITALVSSGLSLYFLRNCGASKMIFSIQIIYLLLMLLIYWIYYWRDFRRDVLTISEISGDRRMTHMKETTLTWQITHFGQKEIQINVFVKRRKAIKKQLIASWESTERTASNNSIVLPLLEGNAEHHTLLPVEMTKSCIGMYEYLCSITITPSADIDDGAVLGVEVEHASLKQTISACRTLNVYNTVAGDTIISDIIGETWLPHMKETTLSFQITGFRPKEIHINLYLKRRNDMKKHPILSWVSVDSPSGGSNNTTYDTTLPVAMKVEMKKTEDGNHECDCRISLTPDADTDDGAVLTVEVAHTALRWPLYRYYILNVIKGDKPSLRRRWNKLFIK